MARSSAYRWQNERKRGLLGKPPKASKSRRRKPRGITNKQAAYLAALQRQLGERYTGNGMSLEEASQAIDRCKERLAEQEPGASHLDAISREESSPS